MPLDLCHISGTVLDPTGQPLVGVTFYVHLVIKDGVLIHDEKKNLGETDEDGLIEFDLPRDCTALISAPVIGLSEYPSPSLSTIPHKTQGGQALTIPDSATANLEDLVPAVNPPSTAVSSSAFNNAVSALEAADSDLQGAIDSIGSRNAANGYAGLDSSGLILDSKISSSIARDSEVTSAIAAEVAARNTAISTAIDNLINGAPGALDTLKELADQLANDESAVTALTTLVNSKFASANVSQDIETDTGSNTKVPSVAAVEEALTVLRGNGYIGMVAIAEWINPHDPTMGGLPTIDGYDVQENDRVLLLAQDQTGYTKVDNGIWIAHENSPWERPADFANGSVHPSGALVFIRGVAAGSNQFFSAWVQLDNSTNDQIPFTVGTDPINSLSFGIFNQDLGGNFIEGPQGPLLDMMTWGRTDSTSVIGKGYALALRPIDLSQVAVIFPDSDPGVEGAAYWDNGVLTRSNG